MTENFSFNGIVLNPGFKIGLEIFDYGTNGTLDCSGMLLVQGQITSYSQIIPLNTFTGDPAIVFLDLANCTVLSLNISLSFDCRLSYCYRTNVFVAKQQGRGGYTLTGSLGSLDLYRGNQFNYPFPNHRQHATPWGVPKRYEFTFSDDIWTVKPPVNYLIKPIFIYCKFDFSSVIASRSIRYELLDNSTQVLRSTWPVLFTAGQAGSLAFYSDNLAANTISSSSSIAPLLKDYLDNQFEFNLVVGNEQAGDEIESAYLYAYSIYIGHTV
jgi:hypothetical protein